MPSVVGAVFHSSTRDSPSPPPTQRPKSRLFLSPSPPPSDYEVEDELLASRLPSPTRTSSTADLQPISALIESKSINRDALPSATPFSVKPSTPIRHPADGSPSPPARPLSPSSFPPPAPPAHVVVEPAACVPVEEDEGFSMASIFGTVKRSMIASVASNSTSTVQTATTSAAAGLTGTTLRRAGNDGPSASGIDSLLGILPLAYGDDSASSSLTFTFSEASKMMRTSLVQATTFSGETITFRRKIKPIAGRAQSNVPDLQRNAIGSIQLLETPIHRLREELKLRAADAPRLERLEQQESSARAKGKGKAIDGENSIMWVDRYRPTKFTDLLGDERVNRETMSWLKEWDQCVFKRKPPRVRKRGMEEADKDGANFNPDPLGRPKDKILLLSGPPGLGKTTLAQIVAAQAGYSVLEINASDDRSGSTVTTRIQNALDAGSKMGNKRPTLMVIDEIDGATGGHGDSFIKSLLQIIQDVPAKKQKGKPTREAKVLMRPIICICNDLYASALRPLRPFARMVRFNKPPVALLVKRLKAICEVEGLSADSRSLNKLSEVTNCDIRSCLNTLQFIKSKTSTLDEATVRSSTVGLKDSGTSMQMVWNALFVPLTAKKSKFGLGVEDGKFVNRLVGLASSNGEFEKLAQGCFEHYPNLKWADSNFVRANHVHDWLHFFDGIAAFIHTNQMFDLVGYMPYALVPWHTDFAVHANASRPTDFPRQDYENYLRRTTNDEVAVALIQGLPPTIRSIYSKNTLLTELAPLLMRILSPNLKPVNAQVIKPDERLTLARLVNIMILHKLRFYQEKGEDGQLSCRLDPPIDVFVHYEGKRAGDIAASRYAVRNLVSQEIEAELLRRNQASIPGGEGASRDFALFKAQPAKESTDLTIEKIATDFFGRPIQIMVPAVAAADAAGGAEGDGVASVAPVPEGRPAKKFRVFYKFHEGSSAAVRRSVKMSQLM